MPLLVGPMLTYYQLLICLQAGGNFVQASINKIMDQGLELHLTENFVHMFKSQKTFSSLALRAFVSTLSKMTTNY